MKHALNNLNRNTKINLKFSIYNFFFLFKYNNHKFRSCLIHYSVFFIYNRPVLLSFSFVIKCIFYSITLFVSAELK